MRIHFRGLSRATFAILAAISFTAPSALADEAPGDGPAAAACITTPTGGDKAIAQTLSDQGTTRNYSLFVPAGLSGAAPLLVMLHGGKSNPTKIEGETGWTEFAKTNKVIVAYPQGSKPDGNASEYAWEFARNTGPDVQFLRHLVGAISTKYCVASNRVHFVGHSNGGQMTTRMACDAADMVASAAVWAGAKGAWDAGDCPASRKISFAVMVNDNDPIIWQWVAEQHRDLWRDKNSCGGANSESGTGVLRGERYDCADGTKVLYRLYDGPDDVVAAHPWPKGAIGADVRNRMWQLFQSNPLP